MTSSTLAALQSAGKDLINGDDLKESDVRTFNRVMPGPNAWYTRLFSEGIRGFIEYDDR